MGGVGITPPMIFMADTLALDSPRRDSAGNLVASVLAARTGIQDYAGFEVGKPEMARVRVLRPAEEVFSRDSMRSFAGAPVTIEHPSDLVTPANWKDHAVGETASDDIVKDGEAVRVPFLLRDAGGIKAVEAGKREISMGYTCDLDWTAGETADGQAYDAVQRGIRINHLAIVDRARGGPKLRIGDSDMTTKTMLIDGLTVDVSNADTAVATITTLIAARDTATAKVATIDTELATLKAEVTTKDAKIATLEQSVKDAKPTPAQLRDAGKALMIVAGQAKALGVTVTDAMDEGAIMKAVVDAKMGDKAKDWNDAQIGASFAVLAKDVKVTDAPAAPFGMPAHVQDAQTEYQDSQAKRKQELRDAWKTPANSNAVAA